MNVYREPPRWVEQPDHICIWCRQLCRGVVAFVGFGPKRRGPYCSADCCAETLAKVIPA